MDATGWDERYRDHELIWGVAPNRWLEQEARGLRAGAALDLACGEGRNAIWLAGLGWRVVAVDFSAVAVAKSRQPEGGGLGGPSVGWDVARPNAFVPPGPGGPAR